MMPSDRKITFKYASSVTWNCIARPDDPYKTLVNEEGALLYDYVNSIPAEGVYWFNKVFSFGLQSPKRWNRISQSTETARHPFVQTVIEYPHAQLTLIAFGHEHDNKRTDIVLWKVECAAGGSAIDTAVWVDGQALGQTFIVPESDPDSFEVYRLIESNRIYMTAAQHWKHIPSFFRVKPHLAKYSDSQPAENTLAYLSTPYPLQVTAGQNFGPVSRMRTRIFTVTPDQPVQGAFIFPVNHTEDSDYNLDWAQQALDYERRFWDTYSTRKLDWHIPDQGVMDMVDACARNILQAREIKDGLPEFQVGPTSYRGLWVVDGYFILEAARYLGHHRAGAQGIDALLRRVQPSGAIMQLDFHPKETAISIATLIRQTELDDAWERLASFWSVIQNGVSYIRWLREESKKRGPEAAEYDLMPATFADGGMGGERPEYTTVLWTLAGLKKAVEAAQKLGYSEDVKRFSFEYDDLLRVFFEKAARDMRNLPDGTPYLPMRMPGASSDHVQASDIEGEVSPYFRINPGTATWALAHAIYPGEVFPPEHPIVQNFCKLLEQIDDDEGVPAGTGWIPHKALWNYAGSFNAHVWLYAGRPDKAIDYLYEFANHASPTRVWREEQSLRSASYEQLVGDMPHNWASAEFIRLARSLIVFERSSGLDLLMGVTTEWIQPNACIRLEATPTRFGPVSINLEIDGDGNGVLTVAFDTGRSQQPGQINLYIPDGFTYFQFDGQDRIKIEEGKVALSFTTNQIIRLLHE
jgi:hypothetical protein